MKEPTRPLTRRSILRASAVTLGSASLAQASPAVLRHRPSDDELRIAVVGIGRRGLRHLWALDCQDWTSPRVTGWKPKRHGPLDRARVVAVCDAFDANLAEGARQVQATHGEVGAYVDYRQMLAKEDLDIVVIATPDHLHAPIAIAAARAGADSYIEKSATNNVEETFELERVLSETGRIVQVGFQALQDHVHEQARRVVANGHIGAVRTIETFLHRGGEDGAWVTAEEKNGGPPREQVHWELFLGDAPPREYDPRRYFGWRRYWDYSTGINGDIFTHVFNTMDYIADLGVPDTVMASGGVHHWRDGRETPDSLTIVCEFEERGTQLVMINTLANSYNDQTSRILGSDGSIELDWCLRVYADRWSEKYAEGIRAGALNPNKPFIDIVDTASGQVVKAAPSQLWLGGRGATLTTRPDGQVRDTTRLHHEELIRCARTREQPSGSFERSFPATMAAHMATLSYREGRRVRWDWERCRPV